MPPGDLLVLVEEMSHEVYKRKGKDLLIAKQITLTEALCGFKVRSF